MSCAVYGRYYGRHIYRDGYCLRCGHKKGARLTAIRSLLPDSEKEKSG